MAGHPALATHHGRRLTSAELTHVQFVLLASLWWLTEVEGESPTQRGLADYAATDPMMTSQVLRSLESKGLVTRAGDVADSRVRRPRVTSSGAALAQRAIQVVKAADADFFAAAGEREGVLQTLHRLDPRLS